MRQCGTQLSYAGHRKVHARHGMPEPSPLGRSETAKAVSTCPEVRLINPRIVGNVDTLI